MKIIYRLVPILVLALVAWAAPASAQTPAQSAPAAPAGAFYAVTYFDVAPADSHKAIALLRQYRSATRSANGNVELTVLHELNRSGRLAIIEGWKDKAAYDANAGAMKELGGKLQPKLLAPFDGRTYVPLAVGSPGDGGVYVVTHVDVFPKGKDDVAGLIKSLIVASQGDSGRVRFDALVSDEHPNHFDLIAAWTDKKAEEAHAAADHTKEFRAKVQPFEGAYYDERRYEQIGEKKAKEPKDQ
ncbi:MAG TPA: antibiotic biosynthesis monooxygenase family protein [Stellaceae bacterium]|jgi:quinol monooxygenase YgiN